MSEETNDASRTIPMVVTSSVAVNAAMLLIVGITFIFCLGDPDSVLNTPTGQPAIQVFYNATQSVVGTSLMVVVIIIILLSACVGQVATSSRQMWSFARDEGKYLDLADFLLRRHFATITNSGCVGSMLIFDSLRIPWVKLACQSTTSLEHSDQCHYCLGYLHFDPFPHQPRYVCFHGLHRVNALSCDVL